MDYNTIRKFPRAIGGRVGTYVKRRDADEQETDFMAMAVFVTAIAGLLVACFYVVSRLAGERAYRNKWNDYDDCGWA
jgi:hypothetical protein